MKSRAIVVIDTDMEKLSSLIRALQHSLFRDQQQLDALDQVLQSAEVRPSSRTPKTVVRMTSSIRIRDCETHKEELYTLVFPDAADISKGLLSVLAPVGMALLGRRKGEVIDARVPPMSIRKHKPIAPSIPTARSLEKKRARAPGYPVGPHGRMGHEGFLARIGGWSGDLSKKATWLGPATGTVRNRPIKDLVDWLNASTKTEQGRRVRAFIHDLKQIELQGESVDFVSAQRFAPLVVREPEREPELIQTIRRIHARIQKACKRYCLYPRLTWVLWEKGWTLDFCAEGQLGEVPIVYNGLNDYGRRVFEGDVAIVVIGIAERGEISRLRACEQCGSWFFASANTSHNARRFCNDACRLKHFHSRKRREVQRR